MPQANGHGNGHGNGHAVETNGHPAVTSGAHATGGPSEPDGDN
jgi:hypothetical protein